MINYFNFKRLDDGNYLITNDLGYYAFLNEERFKALVSDSLNNDIELIEKNFIYDDVDIAVNKGKYIYREMKNYLLSATSLHIFVLTNECNFRCLYCQARDNKHHVGGVMSEETARKAVDLALQSPEKNLNFEFQGGEPLTNFKVLKYIVEYANSNKVFHNIKYSVVTNSSLLDDEILDFIKTNNISISTSLDGPKKVQDLNRPFASGEGSYDVVVDKIRSISKNGYYIGAIETTSKYGLEKYKELIDEYLNLGLQEIFIRPLTKLGMASNDWDKIGYTSADFKKYYHNCLDYILELNKKGIFIREGHACTFIKKILGHCSVNYMELRSPCGAAIGQMAYYHDGNVFTCDEGRMLFEMGDDAFKIGNVNESTYKDLIASSASKAAIIASTTECLPGCSECVYQPYCGVCPVVIYGENKNIFANKAHNSRCELYMAMLDVIFEYLKQDDQEILDIFESWIN